MQHVEHAGNSNHNLNRIRSNATLHTQNAHEAWKELSPIRGCTEDTKCIRALLSLKCFRTLWSGLPTSAGRASMLPKNEIVAPFSFGVTAHVNGFFSGIGDTVAGTKALDAERLLRLL